MTEDRWAEAGGQLACSVALSGRPLMSIQQVPRLLLTGNRRDLRALRAQAMAELAVAWRSPECRQRWQASGQ